MKIEVKVGGGWVGVLKIHYRVSFFLWGSVGGVGGGEWGFFSELIHVTRSLSVVSQSGAA